MALVEIIINKDKSRKDNSHCEPITHFVQELERYSPTINTLEPRYNGRVLEEVEYFDLRLPITIGMRGEYKK